PSSSHDPGETTPTRPLPTTHPTSEATPWISDNGASNSALARPSSNFASRGHIRSTNPAAADNKAPCDNTTPRIQRDTVLIGYSTTAASSEETSSRRNRTAEASMYAPNDTISASPDSSRHTRPRAR